MSQHQPTEDCRQIFAALSSYLDLELPPEACAQLEEHLRDCAPCIEFVESLKQTIALCRQYSPEELPEGLNADAKSQLEEAYRKMLAGRQG